MHITAVRISGSSGELYLITVCWDKQNIENLELVLN